MRRLINYGLIKHWIWSTEETLNKLDVLTPEIVGTAREALLVGH